MEPDRIKAIIHNAGLSYREASLLLRLSDVTDARTVRRWISGERPISGPASIILEMLEAGELPRRYHVK